MALREISGHSLLNEPRPQFRRWDHARILLAEPPVAMAGDKAIHWIAENAWHHDARVAQRPCVAKVPGHSEGCGAFRESNVIFDKHEAVGVCGIDAVLREKSLPQFRLQRGEAEDASRIALDDEAYRPGAEVAHAVEEDEGRGVRYGRVTHDQ